MNPWRGLYKAGAIAVVLVLALVPVQMAVYVAHPLPATVADWFALFDAKPLVGLVDMDALMLVDDVAIGVMFLALWVALRRASPSLMLAALVAELMSIAAYFASNTAFQMLSLSDRFATASSDAERVSLLGAGESMLATWRGSAYDVSYVLAAVATLLVSIVMLRSFVFTRTTGWIGVMFALLNVVPATAGRLGLVMSIASLLPMWIWMVLVARTLFRLARPPVEVRSSEWVVARSRPLRST